MFALLPVIGGLLLGWLAPRKIAIALQVVLFAIATTILTISAPDHGGSYRDSLWIGPALALVSAATLLAGFWLHRRIARRTSTAVTTRDR
jgi:hypothetical protein